MKRTDVVVIGAGQAGLAVSHELTARGIDHVVLERGRIGERWRSERWDSLRLLSPNWHTRLPGFRYAGSDPDGYMTMSEVTNYLEDYAASFAPPIEPETNVVSLQRSACCGYRVITSGSTWMTRAVVIATGESERTRLPAMARYLSPDIVHIHPNRYRRPADVPRGRVLVVGASASGVQLADELQASGREVMLAVGHHTRLPRLYRGRDIFWWMDRLGLFDESSSSVADPDASLNQPSMQLVGRPDHATLGLRELARRGVRLTGRLIDIDRWQIELADDLVATAAAADLKLAGLLQRIDRFIDSTVGTGELAGVRLEPAPAFEPSWQMVAAISQPRRLNLRTEGIQSVVWATGFEPAYPWLNVPVLDGSGGIQHTGGITPSPGLYVVGLKFLRRRKSSFIDGVGDDARELVRQLAGAFEQQARSA